jgi:membrane-bound inhibitor of C-type lysozyme
MKTFALTGLVLATCVIAGSAMAAPTAQPPMNSFNFAFYTCDNGAAFQISYDADAPTKATLTTSDNKQHPLKREPVANGAQFSDQGVMFWTDGTSVVVKGTQIPLNNCKLKAN